MQTIMLRIKAYVWWMLFREIIIITEGDRDSWRKAVDIQNLIVMTQKRIIVRLSDSVNENVYETVIIDGHAIKMIGCRQSNGSIKYHWEF